MKLIRVRSGMEPEIIITGTEANIINKIHELNLCDWHDSYFYEIGKFENMGLKSSTHDYYMMVYEKDEKIGFELERD